MSEAVQQFIQHHGVKGMKWGVRKSRTGSSSGGTAKTRRTRSRTIFAKSPSKLTNAELERRIKRMEMEKRYNDLNKRDVSVGEKMATEVLTNVGKQVVTNVATKTLTGLGTIGVKGALSKAAGTTGTGGKVAEQLLKELTSKKK